MQMTEVFYSIMEGLQLLEVQQGIREITQILHSYGQEVVEEHLILQIFLVYHLLITLLLLQTIYAILYLSLQIQFQYKIQLTLQ